MLINIDTQNNLRKRNTVSMCMKIAQITNIGIKTLVEKFADKDYFVITLSLINVSIMHIKWLYDHVHVLSCEL